MSSSTKSGKSRTDISGASSPAFLSTGVLVRGDILEVRNDRAAARREEDSVEAREERESSRISESQRDRGLRLRGKEMWKRVKKKVQVIKKRSI